LLAPERERAIGLAPFRNIGNAVDRRTLTIGSTPLRAAEALDAPPFACSSKGSI
jgi:hypothetical protein